MSASVESSSDGHRTTLGRLRQMIYGKLCPNVADLEGSLNSLRKMVDAYNDEKTKDMTEEAKKSYKPVEFDIFNPPVISDEFKTGVVEFMKQFRTFYLTPQNRIPKTTQTTKMKDGKEIKITTPVRDADNNTIYCSLEEIKTLDMVRKAIRNSKIRLDTRIIDYISLVMSYVTDDFIVRTYGNAITRHNLSHSASSSASPAVSDNTTGESEKKAEKVHGLNIDIESLDSLRSSPLLPLYMRACPNFFLKLQEFLLTRNSIKALNSLNSDHSEQLTNVVREFNNLLKTIPADRKKELAEKKKDKAHAVRLEDMKVPEKFKPIDINKFATPYTAEHMAEKKTGGFSTAFHNTLQEYRKNPDLIVGRLDISASPNTKDLISKARNTEEYKHAYIYLADSFFEYLISMLKAFVNVSERKTISVDYIHYGMLSSLYNPENPNPDTKFLTDILATVEKNRTETVEKRKDENKAKAVEKPAAKPAKAVAAPATNGNGTHAPVPKKEKETKEVKEEKKEAPAKEKKAPAAKKEAAAKKEKA